VCAPLLIVLVAVVAAALGLLALHLAADGVHLPRHRLMALAAERKKTRV
jgi:hypothetical protein